MYSGHHHYYCVVLLHPGLLLTIVAPVFLPAVELGFGALPLRFLKICLDTHVHPSLVYLVPFQWLLVVYLLY